MHHFLFEFITGGGLSDQELPESLLNEGELMLQTLTKELSEINDTQISLTRDGRLALYEKEFEQYSVTEKPDKKLPELLKKADVCWLIAPESDASLEKYAKIFIDNGKLFIGSSSAAIKITSSKFLTNKILSENNIKVVETEWISDSIPKSNTGLVIKPDDGVGAEDTYLFDSKAKVEEFMSNREFSHYVVQPYINGKHMSMSLLVYNNDVRLLACNQQYVSIKENKIRLEKIGVNECLSFKNDMLVLAKNIISSIKGFSGYIGIDLIEKDNELYVLEINPRFTTAYAGISESIGKNVTSLILNTFIDKKLPDIELESAIPVIINI